MLIAPIIHLLFGLITMSLFCAAAIIAAGRAPRHLLWTALLAASSVCAAVSSGVNLLFLRLMQQGNSLSSMNGILAAQGVLSGLSSLLLLGAAVALVVILLGERTAVAASSQNGINSQK